MSFQYDEGGIPKIEQCADCDSILFVFSYLGELTEEEKNKLDEHSIDCGYCLGLSLQIAEIMSGADKPTDTEFKLLLKFFATRLWSVKEDQIVDEIIRRLEARGNLKNNSLPNTLLALKQTLEAKEVAILHELSKAQQKQEYLESGLKELRYKTTAIIFLLFISSLVFCTFLFFSPTKNPDMQEVKTTSPKVNDQSINEFDPFNFTNKSVNTLDLYSQLDLAIDAHLSSNGSFGLAEAYRVAKEIKNNYKDNYGVDLVGYYSSLSVDELEKAQTHRQQLSSLKFRAGETGSTVLKNAKVLVDDLLSVGNKLEAYKARLTVAKIYALTFNHNPDNDLLLSDAIRYCTENKYLFLKVGFLLWKAKNENLELTHEEIEHSFREVINLAKDLKLQQIEGSATMSLAMSCHQNNHNKEALDLTVNAINRELKYNNMAAIWYTRALAEFKLGMWQASEQHLYTALELAKSRKDIFNVGLCYVFLGLTASESGLFNKAEAFFNEAEKVGNALESEPAFDLFSRINGYRAKSKLLEGDYASAIFFYKDTLAKLQKLNVKNSLELSQVSTGLAISLEKTGQREEAIKYRLTGEHYFEAAQAKHERADCLMSFLPMRLQCD